MAKRMVGVEAWLLAQALSVGSSGAAQPVTQVFELQWRAPEGCPSEGEVRLATERLLSASRARPVEASLHATARVYRRADRYDLLLTLGEGASARRRELHAPVCQELAQATALVVALAVDPSLALADESTAEATPGATRAHDLERATAPCADAKAAEPPRPTLPPGLPSQPAAPPPACPVLAAPAPNRLRAEPSRSSNATSVSRGWRLGAGAEVALGSLPGLLPRPELSAAYVTRALRAELGAFVGFGAEGPRPERGAGGVFELWGIAPRVCRRFHTSTPRWDACGVAELGWLRASGFGADRTLTQSSFWFAAGLALEARFPVGATGEIGIGARMSWVATRDRFQIAGDELFRPQALVPALRLSGEWGVF